VEKILEVGEQCSIMKIFFVINGVQKACIAIAIKSWFFTFFHFFLLIILRDVTSME
jgi:hypothetical protein